MQFEIITSDGSRFHGGHDFIWQYGLKQGSIDELDRSVVEIINFDNVVVQTISDVIAAGQVTDATTLQMPKEIRRTICPQCGYVEVE